MTSFTASKALTVFVLAIYLGFSLGLFNLVGESWTNGKVEVAEEDFPCKSHQCGCDSAIACRTRCCCFPPASIASSSLPSCHADEKSDRQKTVNFFINQSCQGPANAMAMNKILLAGTHLHSEKTLVFSLSSLQIFLGVFSPYDSCFIDPLDKIPIHFA